MYLRRWRWSCLIAVALLAVFMTGFALSLYHVIFTLELLPWYPRVDHLCQQDHEQIFQGNLEVTEKSVTVVTMFIDLGIFKKGNDIWAYHSPFKYRKWMRTFSKMTNPVVAFIEKDEDIIYFRQIRSCIPSNLTQIIKIDRNKLSSFKYVSHINKIYSDPNYPKHYPNTVSAEYTCTMHAKYDVLEKVCLSDYLKTPYIAWVDVGLFRHLDETNYNFFELFPPKTFDDTAVGLSFVWPVSSKLPVETVMRKNLVWVAGGMVLAKRKIMLSFIHQYHSAVTNLLKRSLSNTDQEVIASMYSQEMISQQEVKIQVFRCKQGQMGLFGPAARYLCLAYLSRQSF